MSLVGLCDSCGRPYDGNQHDLGGTLPRYCSRCVSHTPTDSEHKGRDALNLEGHSNDFPYLDDNGDWIIPGDESDP